MIAPGASQLPGGSVSARPPGSHAAIRTEPKPETELFKEKVWGSGRKLRAPAAHGYRNTSDCSPQKGAVDRNQSRLQPRWRLGSERYSPRLLVEESMIPQRGAVRPKVCVQNFKVCFPCSRRSVSQRLQSTAGAAAHRKCESHSQKNVQTPRNPGSDYSLPI